MEWLLLAFAVVLTMGTGICVAAEFSLVTLDRPTVEATAAQTNRASDRTVVAALRSLSTQLSGAQLGITLTTLLTGFLAEPSVATLLRGPLTSAGLPEGAVEPVALGSSIVLATGFSMIVGELVPKNLAIAVPLATARWSAPPLYAFGRVALPLIKLCNGTANRILRAMGVEPQEELSSARSPEELASLVNRSAEAGTLDAGTATRLRRSLAFSSRDASDVMTPRMRTVTLNRDATAADVLALARSTGHSRFPVVDEGGLDDVLGVVHVKRAVAVPHERRADVPVTALMSDIARVPETVRLDPLLVELREQGLQLAVVVDEHGGVSGVVTLEDVVEELVGEVADEHDRTRSDVRKLRDGSVLLPGLLRPDEARERTGAPVPDAPLYETVGGFVMASLGRLPVVGDEVALERGSLRVSRMDGRRVDRVQYRIAAQAAGTQSHDASPADGVVGVEGVAS